MKHIATKMLRIMFGVVVTLALAASFTAISVGAASNGIYIADASPHYKHPISGKIEDAGGDGSAVLGQSMTESATYRKALVEVDGKGNTYVTVRLKLMDNIQDPKFQVDGKSVSAELMQEDYTNNTADYRMKTADENSIIRCEMYVVPMGRKVIFYITVANLKAGHGDFITSVKVEQHATAHKPSVTSKATEQKKNTSSSKATTAESKTQKTTISQQSTTAVISTKPDSSVALGLEEFDASGNVVNEKAETKTENNGNAVIWVVLGLVAAVLIVGGCVWYFVFFKKKK